MQPINLKNWSSLERRIKDLRKELGSRAETLLFRGQGNSKFALTTTLERWGCEGMSFRDYYRLLVRRMRPHIQSFTSVDVPEHSRKVEKSFEDRELLSMHRFPQPDLYEYMIYLRHHGFPSPLLDWSRSPYVAAFFAFRDPPSQDGKPRKRSIYAYCEMPAGYKGGAVGGVTIHPIGPYVRGHRRHFRQQSDYTICGEFDTASGDWRFRRHDAVFGRRPGQDVLWKFDLPSTERTEVLRFLNEFNMNSFSLFDSEESLLETLWFNEYVVRQRAPASRMR